MLVLALCAGAVSGCFEGRDGQPAAENSATTEPGLAPSSDTVEDAYFVDAFPFDEQVRRNGFTAEGIDPASPVPAGRRRIKLVLQPDLYLVGGDPPDVCHDFMKNVELHGGEWDAGCSAFPISAEHPNRSRFSKAPWRAADPIAHLDAIRQRQRDICEQVNRWDIAAGREPSNPDTDDCWRKLALAYKRVIAEGRLAVETANIDVDGNGLEEVVVRFAVRDRLACYAHDGSIDLDWAYAMVGDNTFARSFNARWQRGAPFIHEGSFGRKLYFLHRDYVSTGYSVAAVGEAGPLPGREYGHRQVCRIQPEQASAN